MGVYPDAVTRTQMDACAPLSRLSLQGPFASVRKASAAIVRSLKQEKI